jgi:hypothetical protein
MHDTPEWLAASVPIDTMNVEICFLLNPDFYIGDSNDHTQFDDPAYREPLVLPTFPRVIDRIARSSEIVGHEQELLKYYASILRRQRERGGGYNDIRHYFWVRLWLWNDEHALDISFPWYDTLSEMRPFFRWLDTDDDGAFSDVEQSWEVEGLTQGELVHLRQGNPDEGEHYANITTPRLALALAAQQAEDRAASIVAQLSREVGFDAWTTYRSDDPLAVVES